MTSSKEATEQQGDSEATAQEESEEGEVQRHRRQEGTTSSSSSTVEKPSVAAGTKTTTTKEEEEEEEEEEEKKKKNVVWKEQEEGVISRKARGVLGIEEGKKMVKKIEDGRGRSSDDSAFSSEEDEQHQQRQHKAPNNGSPKDGGGGGKKGLTAKYLQTLAALARANADNVFSSLDSNLSRHREAKQQSQQSAGKGLRGKMASNLRTRFSKSKKECGGGGNPDRPFDAPEKLLQKKEGGNSNVVYASSSSSSSHAGYDDVSQTSHRYLDLLGLGQSHAHAAPQYSELGSVAYSEPGRSTTSAYGTSMGTLRGNSCHYLGEAGSLRRPLLDCTVLKPAARSLLYVTCLLLYSRISLYNKSVDQGKPPRTDVSYSLAS